jgi:tetratricopeptide (TPR) repeat protein
MILSAQTEVQTEMAARFQQMFTMLQEGQVRQRSRSLSMHSQVEPAGFNSQTTRVGDHPRLCIFTNRYHYQIVANTTTSTVAFSILSPDASLSYDRIKLRLEEYRTLLASASDTIEIPTENGKTIICQKEADEMDEYLDRAEILLRDVIQSRDISTLVVLYRLADLAEVLDKLKLYDECRLTGNCALDLAEALGRRSLEFRNEQSDTLARIAGISAYKPRARTLFIQAVSICEEVVENDASYTNKNSLLFLLDKAGCWDLDHSDQPFAQWLGRAVQLMTKDLPPTAVDTFFRSRIYNNYGMSLRYLKQYSNALEAYHEAVSIFRTLVDNDPAKYNHYCANTLLNMGAVLDDLGKYDDAIVAYKEAQEIYTAMSAQYPLRYNEGMARTLYQYGITLGKLNQVSEAAAVHKQAISLLRDLSQTGNECTELLCCALHCHGIILNSLGQHTEAVLASRESILLRRALVATDSKGGLYPSHLAGSLMTMGVGLNLLGKYDDAVVAYEEAHEIYTTISAQDPLRYNKPMANTLYNYGIALGSLNRVSEAAAVEQQAISLLHDLAQTGNECTELLCDTLQHYGIRCGALGQHAKAVLAYQESILLRRALVATDSEQEIWLIVSLHKIAFSFHALDKHAEANTAAKKALERNRGKVLEDCDYAPDFGACFVCQRVIIPESLQNVSPPLPVLQAISSPQPVEHPGADDSLTPAETSTSATSAHIPPTMRHTH